MTSARQSKDSDFTRIVQALPALARKMALDTLSIEVMNLAMESVDGEKGYLLLEKDGRWEVEAIGERNEDNGSAC